MPSSRFLSVLLVSSFVGLTGPIAAQGCLGAATVNTCEIGISKNICGLGLGPGAWNAVTCFVPGVISTCTTLQGRSVVLGGAVTSNGQSCNALTTCTVANGRCDEAPNLVGTLKAAIDLNAQRSGCCPGRGSWSGQWTLADPTGVLVANGRLDATMGVGTHRANNCTLTAGCSKNCERCYDAAFDPLTSTWRIGSEGFMEGPVTAGPYAGCQLRASFQGDWKANGDVNGPLPSPFPPTVAAPAWSFCGTIDGVLECPCI